MKPLPTKNEEALKALYDRAPYPAAVEGQTMRQQIPLLEHWINAAVGRDGKALYPQARILVAGCGSGEEVFMLAQRFPKSMVVGVDFSEASIAYAEETAKKLNVSNIDFAVADITKIGWVKKYEPFDFILCHAVADYVNNPKAMFETLATGLAPTGVVYMMVNSPQHPAHKIQAAFQQLGMDSTNFSDTPQERQLLQSIVKLMGEPVGIDNLGAAAKSYLDIDIFPAIAHHFSMKKWCQVASEAGLTFCGSMDALIGLANLWDEELPALYGLGRAALSHWTANLRQGIGYQLLFSKCNITEPSFVEKEVLLGWKPILTPSLGGLPRLKGNPQEPKPLTLRFQNLPDFTLHTTAYDLEVLRQCTGQHSLSHIIASIDETGDWNNLKACLFRAYHYGLLFG